MEKNSLDKKFVTYEIALKLKELGYNEPCFGWFLGKLNFLNNDFEDFKLDITQGMNWSFEECKNSNFLEKACSAPLWQDVIDWFKSKYNFEIYVRPNHHNQYQWDITTNWGKSFARNDFFDCILYKTLYEARKIAILKAIELTKTTNMEKTKENIELMPTALDVSVLSETIKENDNKTVCPICGSEEIDAMTPRTKYKCGSSDYDQRPGTFKQSKECKIKSDNSENKLIPSDAHSFEVFAIKDNSESPTGKEAFIGFKLNNGNFHFIGVPYTEPKIKINKNNMKNYTKKDNVIICECNDCEHNIIFSYFSDEPDVYIHIHLKPENNIFKRILKGIKYVFGYKSKYGNYDEFIIGKNSIEKVEEILNKLKEEE